MNLFGGIYTETGLKKFSKNKGRTPVSGSALKRNWLFYSSFLITKAPNPPHDVLLRFPYTAAVKRQSFFHLCPWAEAADIVLMDDKPSKIAHAIRIARRTLSIVRQNIVFALAVKLLVLVLSAAGWASMWAAVFADVGVSVIAILNAMRCLRQPKQI